MDGVSDLKNICPGKGPWNLKNRKVAHKTGGPKEKTGIFMYENLLDIHEPSNLQIKLCWSKVNHFILLNLFYF